MNFRWHQPHHSVYYQPWGKELCSLLWTYHFLLASQMSWVMTSHLHLGCRQPSQTAAHSLAPCTISHSLGGVIDTLIWFPGRRAEECSLRWVIADPQPDSYGDRHQPGILGPWYPMAPACTCSQHIKSLRLNDCQNNRSSEPGAACLTALPPSRGLMTFTCWQLCPVSN